MAEAALFTIASNLLCIIATPVFNKAYERARSIHGASDELKELQQTIISIQAVLLDAEKQHNNSAMVKNWVGRVRDVLHDAEDLLDVVATNDLLKQQKKRMKTVRVFLSRLNSVASNDFIAKKVKSIRKDLQRISDDMTMFEFVKCQSEKQVSGIRGGVETGSFVAPEEIVGRREEKERVVNFVYDDAYVERHVSLFSIVGIGGMGKSALTQLVYNDVKIRDDFQHRYWACVSDIFDEKEVLGKIYQSMTTEQWHYQGLSLHQVQSIVRESIDKNGKFLLVLDDLWDEDVGRGKKLWSILSTEKAKGSKIIITTRQLSVAKALQADETLELKGLSDDASWELFRRYAFTKERENDQAWISIGEMILSKCVNVPLAIKSIASLLRAKDTIGEWKSLVNEQLSQIEPSDNPIMSTLRLSYDHLPSHLKNCFAYCSLFPKNHLLDKQDLIYLWIAQGYIKPKKDETLYMAGHAYFMELLRRSFFQEVQMDYLQDQVIESCKMHDLIHDMAQYVAGDEIRVITAQGTNQSSHNKIRHINVSCKMDESFNNTPFSSLEADRLRSSLFNCVHSYSSHLDGQFTKFRFLRALSIEKHGMKSVPDCIGEMKLLRYLNLSHNWFTHLPDSITKLVNLITLDVSSCYYLRELPREIRQLVSLRHLHNELCSDLVYMPPTMSEMTSLERLSLFRVSKSGGADTCRLEALARLNLRGSLTVEYDRSTQCRTDDLVLECWQVPDTLEELEIIRYPNTRMDVWKRDVDTASSRLLNLENLYISNCINVENLAPLRCLPFLKHLHINELPELQYIEDEDDASTTVFFPCLRTLRLGSLQNLKEWSSRPENSEALTFPSLSDLFIRSCLNLVSWSPLTPNLKQLQLDDAREELVQQIVSKPDTHRLERFEIKGSRNLTNLLVQGLTSLRKLEIIDCDDLVKVRVASPNSIEELTLAHCPHMKLWEEGGEEEERSMEWASFRNLRILQVDRIPESRLLPECLQHLGKFQISRWLGKYSYPILSGTCQMYNDM